MFKKEIQFDAENHMIRVPLPSGGGEVPVSVFDRVEVVIEVEKDKNTQRGKVKMTLARPFDSTGL